LTTVVHDSVDSSYQIKTFGATKADVRFNRLPTVIQRAKEAIPDDNIVGFLLCALERPPLMTGLMFCDHRHDFPEGLPARTPPVVDRFYREGYEVVKTEGGGLYVVAHHYYQNGALRPFFEVH
jgi:hypothetical protein